MKKYFYTIYTYLSIGLKVYWYGWKYTKKIAQELQQNTNSPLPCLTKEDWKRIEFYVVQSVLVSSWVMALKDRKFSKQKMRKAAYLGAMTPLLDDLTDHSKTDSSVILQQLTTHHQEAASSSSLLKAMYQEVFTDDRPYFMNIFQRAMRAQDASLAQLEASILTEKTLEEITKNKGGLFTLLFWIVIDDTIQPEEQRAVMCLGYALQQINDLFDVYKDHQNGQQTLFTNTNSLVVAERRFRQTINTLVNQFAGLGYDKKNIRKCLMEISTILGRGIVSLHQLQALQTKNDDPFNIAAYSRKELICDMEKPANLYQSFQYSVQFYERLEQRFQDWA